MIYLAISYICNQKCSFCPCGTLRTQHNFLELPDISAFLEAHKDVAGRHIVISGGEPTLHPDFAEILSMFQRANFYITVLSTSERFSDPEFTRNVFGNLDPARIKIITTLHSHKAEEHEIVNQTPGSFYRSIQGINNVATYHCKVVVKHCITKMNYQNLREFYSFVNRTFPVQIDMQLCSIDYCQISKNEEETEFVSFPMIKAHLEDMLDAYFVDLHHSITRNLYCINLPLCAAEPIYWKVFQKNSAHYEEHVSPNETGGLQINIHVDNIVSPSVVYCKDCLVKNSCAGTYHSAFDIYGSRMIQPYL